MTEGAAYPPVFEIAPTNAGSVPPSESATDHTTVGSEAFCNCAVKGCDPPAPREADGGLMVMLTGFSVTDALADLVESSCETALTVTTICVAIEAGAVYQAEPEPPSTIVPIVLPGKTVVYVPRHRRIAGVVHGRSKALSATRPQAHGSEVEGNTDGSDRRVDHH